MDLRIFILSSCIVTGPTAAYATILFESGASNGAPMYLGESSRHSGGGYISFLGGELTNGYNPGDGTQDYRYYTNVVIDNSDDARNPHTGTDYAFKTHYRAGEHARSYQKNTTIIKFPETDVLYVRWYQKWSSEWLWPSDQQKLLKIKGDGISQNFKVSFGNNYINLTHLSPEPYSNLNETYVFSRFTGEKTAFRQEDSINNRLGQNGEDINYPLNTNQWYCIETYVKANDQGVNNAEYRYWINDQLAFELVNTKARTDASSKIRLIEMQHVLQWGDGRDHPRDTPTWMTDIVLSTERIGCGSNTGSISPQGAKPNPPTNLRLD